MVRYLLRLQNTHLSITKGGFSLLELSIVLVIIGLITGGVVMGRSVIHQAALQGISKDIEQFDTALLLFVNKYNTLPGDMANATSYWAEDSDSCSGYSYAGDGVCNGDGNNNINFMDEMWFAWEHLSKANMIKGTYDGELKPDRMRPGENTPDSDLDGAHFHMWNIDSNFASSKKVHVSLQGDHASTSTFTTILKGGLDAQDAFYFDNKFDDGDPTIGKISANKGIFDPANSCRNSANQYALDTSHAKTCRVFFELSQ